MGGRIAILLALCCSTSFAEEIPLSEIWAYRMPGTKYIVELDPYYAPPNLDEKERNKRSVIRKMIRRLALPREEKLAGEAFAVKETGLEALKQAEEVLSSGQEPTHTFSTHDNISLFFFVRLLSAYVHIDEVTREGDRITIRYHLVRHITQNSSTNKALIPLGKLPTGKYTVEIVAGPQQVEGGDSENQFRELTQAELDRYVSRGFSFEVK